MQGHWLQVGCSMGAGALSMLPFFHFRAQVFTEDGGFFTGFHRFSLAKCLK
jgi:hypothetical protein